MLRRVGRPFAKLDGKSRVIECGCGRYFEMAGGKDQLEMGAVAMEGLLSEFRAGNIGQGDDEKGRLKRHLRELSRRWGDQDDRCGGRRPCDDTLGGSRRHRT